MLQRMLINKMENRILVGITAFVGIMILVGWVAINENARMESFKRQFEARSIERGAELFASNCATCHGENGRGLQGRAPALNSPHFFGYNYFAEVNSEIDNLQDRQAQLNEELDALREEMVSGEVSEERRQEILARREEISQEISGEDGIQDQLEQLQAEKQNIADQLQPAAQNGYPLSINDGEVNVQPSRLDQIEWGSTLYDFVFTTLVHGRPTSISYWEGNQMVAWSQRAGGPLRDDEIDDLTNYILNWDKGDDWTIEDALTVNQYAIQPVQPGAGGQTVEADPAGTDVDAIISQIEEEGITGDPERGEALYTSSESSQLGSNLGCQGCHDAGAGPATEETWDAFPRDPQFEDISAERYLIESIVQPGAYLVEGWGAAMPGNFGERMSVQDIADVVTYIRSFGSETDHNDSFLQEGSGESSEDGGDGESSGDSSENSEDMEESGSGA